MRYGNSIKEEALVVESKVGHLRQFLESSQWVVMADVGAAKLQVRIKFSLLYEQGQSEKNVIQSEFGP